MLRRTLQIAVLVSLVALALAYPIIESLDYWDPPGPASDTELQEIALLTFAGVLFLVARLLIIMADAGTHLHPHLCLHTLTEDHFLTFRPYLTASPPVALRI
jgi:hypothetical protein